MSLIPPETSGTYVQIQDGGLSTIILMISVSMGMGVRFPISPEELRQPNGGSWPSAERRGHMQRPCLCHGRVNSMQHTMALPSAELCLETSALGDTRWRRTRLAVSQ